MEKRGHLAPGAVTIDRIDCARPNRASVVVWSVANETPITAERTRFLKTLVDTARSLDGSRLISAAMEYTATNRTPTCALWTIPLASSPTW